LHHGVDRARATGVAGRRVNRHPVDSATRPLGAGARRCDQQRGQERLGRADH
jgi:hypothetical protein